MKVVGRHTVADSLIFQWPLDSETGTYSSYARRIGDSWSEKAFNVGSGAAGVRRSGETVYFTIESTRTTR